MQATTWSGPDQVAGTDGFTRDADAVLRAVVAYFGGSTAFPLDLLRRTHLGDPAAAPSPRGAARPTSPSSRTTASTRCSGSTGSRPTRRPGRRCARRTAAAPWCSRSPADWAARFEDRADGYAVHSVVTEDDLLTFVRRMAASTWGGDRGPSTR